MWLQFWAEEQFASLPSHNSAQLKFLLAFPPAPRVPTPWLERQHAPENTEMVLGDSPPSCPAPHHINGNSHRNSWMKALLVIKV